jgi:crotonobetainyl-CoA:carnitine CoA-transferase CaiB-like acyl-CoA transferase
VIQTYDYPVDDPSAKANRYILDLEHPSFGAIQSLGFPIYMSDSPARMRRLAPAVGQHSAEILQERLGYSDAEIERFEQDGTI